MFSPNTQVAKHQRATLVLAQNTNTAWGYELDGVPYGFVPNFKPNGKSNGKTNGTQTTGVADLAFAHALALGFHSLLVTEDLVTKDLGTEDLANYVANHPDFIGLELLICSGADAKQAEQAALLAMALKHLALAEPVSPLHLNFLRQQHPVITPQVHIKTDGSADKHSADKHSADKHSADKHSADKSSTNKQSDSLSLAYTLNSKPYAVLLENFGHEGLAEREAIWLALTHAKLLRI